MNRFLSLIALSTVSLFLGKANAQSWVTQAPYPTYNKLFSVDFPSAEVGYLGGENGTLLKTIDGGATWNQINYPQYMGGVNFNFLNNDTGYFANGSHIVKTMDGGETWESTSLHYWHDANGTYFLNDTLGYAYGYYSVIYKTTDAGETWNLLSFSADLYNEYIDMEFVNLETGFLIEYYFDTSHRWILKRTDDGGNTWSTVNLPDEVIDVNAIEAFTPNDFWIGSGTRFPNGNYYTGLEARAYHTTDGGLTWTAHSLGMVNLVSGGPIINDVTFFNELEGRVIGYGHTYITSDGGITWQDNINFDINPTPYSNNTISWINKDTCYIVGYTPSLLRTYDGGVSYEELIPDGEFQHECVYFSDTLHGFTAGSDTDVHPFIKYTHDGGVVWNSAILDTIFNNTIFDLHFYDNNNGLALAAEGFYRTSDGGTTWHYEDGPNPFIKNKLEVTQNGIIYTASAYGQVFKSYDNGLTWVNAFAGQALEFLLDFQFIDDLTGFMLVSDSPYPASGGEIWNTTDGGYSWNKLDYGSNLMAVCFDFTDRQHGIIGLKGGQVLFTNNEGETWTLSENTLPQSATYIKMFNSMQAVAVCDDKCVATTNDGGASFQIIYNNSNANWPFITKSTCFVSQDHGWAVGGQGMIQRYDSHITSINKHNLPVKYTSFLVPNPAVKNVMAIDDEGQLIISTLAGLCVLHTNISRGELINISSLPSGIYIATLIKSKEIKSMKLVKQ